MITIVYILLGAAFVGAPIVISFGTDFICGEGR